MLKRQPKGPPANLSVIRSRISARDEGWPIIDFERWMVVDSKGPWCPESSATVGVGQLQLIGSIESNRCEGAADSRNAPAGPDRSLVRLRAEVGTVAFRHPKPLHCRPHRKHRIRLRFTKPSRRRERIDRGQLIQNVRLNRSDPGDKRPAPRPWLLSEGQPDVGRSLDQLISPGAVGRSESLDPANWLGQALVCIWNP